MTALLELEGVHVRLGGRTVVAGADLEVAPGEVVGLLGPNGAGKTTLLRAATGAIPRARGSVRVAGAPLEALDRRALARLVAVVPQSAEVPFAFRAGEVVLMGRTPHLGWLAFERTRDIEAAREAMERVGIASLASRSLLELSGGERQLVLVARALAQEPRLLLLDEPTAHLDLRHRLEVLALVRGLADEGRGALWISHDLALAARYCDRLALLADGALVACGPPAAVLTPDAVRRVFGVEAQVAALPDGTPVVVPMAPAHPATPAPAPAGAPQSAC